MMIFKKIQPFIIWCGVFMFIACGGPKKQTQENVYAHDELYTEEFTLEDSTGGDFSGQPYPMAVDESFDDFVFAYAANKDFQVQRTTFPLRVYEANGDSSVISKLHWKPDSLFTDRYFYTILFDQENDMELISNPDITEAKVEWIYLNANNTKSYNFERIDKVWMLKSISKGYLEKYNNEEFVKFYNRFATDSLFQISRITVPLEYITIDPEDDFEILETVIDANSWTSLKPVLPTNKLVNINYGQEYNSKSKTKVLAVKGIGNGFSNVFFFKLNSKGFWELYKFEDVGV